MKIKFTWSTDGEGVLSGAAARTGDVDDKRYEKYKEK